ncbi:MAG: VanZ family protein [Candidatus Latescibacteria bacterium]|nr:VanZ family protein [Candidatus Latescibacterota bacterium]
MTTQRKFNWTIWLPPLLWMALIFVGSSIPGGPADDATRSASGTSDPIHIQRIKDAVHITEFGILMFLLGRSFKLTGVRTPLIVALAVTVVYGVSDEIHQYFVPQRYPDIGDVIRNVVGAVIAFVVFRWWQAHQKSQTKTW